MRAAIIILVILTSTGLMAKADQNIQFEKVDVINRRSELPAGWYQDGVIMLVYVRAYQDSNGDGNGDLNGLIQRLDYVRSLGIKGIWLTPITESADHDHGYAVKDYRKIESHYGSMEDFDRLLREAHKRGIGIIIDYVLNHSAKTHPLFIASMDSKSYYRNYYIWRNEKPGGWRVFGKDPWHPGQTGWYYYGAFGPSMPDFNLMNREVVGFHKDNIRFWLNKGVDGIRFDAVGVLVENGPEQWINQPEGQRLMGEMREVVNQYQNRYVVCEAASAPKLYADTTSCGSSFAFGLQGQIVDSIEKGIVRPGLVKYLKEMPMSRLATFLALHDIHSGKRLISVFSGDERKSRIAAATLFAFPGIPIHYYGEEIGMSLPESAPYPDAAERGPMSWTDNRQNAGFSTTNNIFRSLAVNSATHNAAVEEHDPNSLLNYWRSLIQLRNKEIALSRGEFIEVFCENDSIFVFIRKYVNEVVLVVLNYGRKEEMLTVNLSQYRNSSWKALFPVSRPVLTLDQQSRGTIRIGPLEASLFKLTKY